MLLIVIVMTFFHWLVVVINNYTVTLPKIQNVQNVFKKFQD